MNANVSVGVQVPAVDGFGCGYVDLACWPQRLLRTHSNVGGHCR
jgi:hypothetical protein